MFLFLQGMEMTDRDQFLRELLVKMHIVNIKDWKKEYRSKVLHAVMSLTMLKLLRENFYDKETGEKVEIEDYAG